MNLSKELLFKNLFLYNETMAYRRMKKWRRYMGQNESDTVISLHINTEVYRAFKMYCVKEGKTIREVATQILEDFVKEIYRKIDHPVKKD
jgi:hypothetical protein